MEVYGLLFVYTEQRLVNGVLIRWGAVLEWIIPASWEMTSAGSAQIICDCNEAGMAAFCFELTWPVAG